MKIDRVAILTTWSLLLQVSIVHAAWTPLHEAAQKGDVATVARLLTGGANVNTRDHAGGTPLHAAARSGSTKWRYCYY